MAEHRTHSPHSRYAMQARVICTHPRTYYCRICTTAKVESDADTKAIRMPLRHMPPKTDAPTTIRGSPQPHASTPRGRLVCLICSRASRRASYARLSGKQGAGMNHTTKDSAVLHSPDAVDHGPDYALYPMCRDGCLRVRSRNM